MDVFDPTSDEITTWAYNTDPKWPAADWDYYVLRRGNDSLIIQLANDLNGPKRLFFVHALYYFVGDTFNSRDVSLSKLRRIQGMLRLVGSQSSQELITWKKNVIKLLDSEIEFDSEKWLHYLFNE